MIPEIELQPAGKIRSFQTERVKETLQYVLAHSPFYKKHFASPGKIATLEDFQTLPVTTKDDLQNHNWEFLCIDRNKVAEYTSTSGTLGRPVTIALTQKDLERLAYNEFISFVCADGTPSDVYQLAVTLDRQFMAGLAYYEGVRKLGAGLIRVGPGLPAMQWETISRLQPSVLVTVPSFLIKLIEFAAENGIDVNKSPVRSAICIGESIRTQDMDLSALGKRITASWNIKLYGTYASTEMQTAFTECSHGNGGHHHPELVYVETLDDQGNPVAEGAPGEVTITTLGVEGMPLVRYKTGDIAVLHHSPCRCGRTTARLGAILGRKQQMIKLKGTTLYPPGIFELLNQFPAIENYVVEVSTDALGTDQLHLHVVTSPENKLFTETKLKAAFQSLLRVIPLISFTSIAETERMQLSGNSRKIRKFIDHRN